MGYSVLCLCNSNELLLNLEQSLSKAEDNFNIVSVECSESIKAFEYLEKVNPSAVIIDYFVGEDKIDFYVSSLKQLPNSGHLPLLLAVPTAASLNHNLSYFSVFDDIIEYPFDHSSLAVRINLTISRRMNTNQLLEKSEQLNDISTAASRAGSSIIIINSAGEIVWVNQGFEMLYECNLEQFREKYGQSVFELEQNNPTAEAMRRCIETGEHTIYESVWFIGDHIRKNIQTSLTPIYDNAGKLTKIIAIETDITDLKMAEEALSDKHDNLLSTMEHLEDANRLLDEQRQEIELQKENLEKEKNKSEALLLNILPEVAAHQLKKKGFVKPKKYNEVSVLFADFVNFSSISVTYESIEDFLAALSYYFESFDEITTKRFIEKIKTIGDCYMCVGGVPQGNKSHPFDTVLAALEIQKFVEEKAKIDLASGNPVWRLRIGIHSGSVMAGVIGKKKFAYDVWGDTVNVASRMESKGEAGKVNVSETTYMAIQDFFKCTYRGKVYAKNIGEINMYFVERILPEFSEDDEGYVPNAAFRRELAKY